MPHTEFTATRSARRKIANYNFVRSVPSCALCEVGELVSSEEVEGKSG